MTRSLDDLPRGLAFATATGVAAGAVAVHRWPRWARWSWHAGWAGLTAVGAMWVLRHPGAAPGVPESTTTGAEQPRDATAASEPTSWPLTLAAGAGVGAAMVGLNVAGEVVDRRLEHALVRHGVRRPRVWIGVAAALVGAAFSPAPAAESHRGSPAVARPSL